MDELFEEFIAYKTGVKLDITPERNDETLDGEWVDYDRIDRKLRLAYKPFYHLNEVLKRITCTEHNLPTNFDEVCSRLSNASDISNVSDGSNKSGWNKEDIYKVLSYQERKSLIYYWCKMNQIPFLQIDHQHYTFIKSIINQLITEFYINNEGLKKLPNYRLMMYCLCVKVEFEYILPYLYFRRNKKNEDLVNKTLDKILNT